MTIKFSIIRLAAILACFLFSSFGVAAKADKKTFVYCSEGSPSTFNPQIATDGTSFNASSHTVYNRLIEFKQGSTEIEPALAESWKVSKDGLHYTFRLRKNVQFHSNEFFKPTRNFNADDVLFSFAIQKEKAHPLAVKNGNYEYFKSMGMDEIIKEIKKIDDYTVEFVLSRQEAPFLSNLAMDFASILSKEYAEALVKAGKDINSMNTQPIGTGPFVFKSYTKDTLIRFTANPNYFAKRPGIDNLVFSITPDASVRTQKLKTGECHFIAEPAPQDLENISQNQNLKLLEKEGMNVGYLAFNTQKKPFNDKRVRLAILYALDRASYISTIYLNRATLAKNPMPPTIWSYNDAVKDFSFNISKAKELLTQAGYPNGFETELWTLPVARPYNPNGKKLGELMQSDLAKVGIKVKLVTFDWPTYLEKSRKGEHQMIQMGWTGDNGDPDNFLHILLGCGSVETGTNVARWCNKDYEQLVDSAKRMTNPGRRADLYKKAQLLFKQESPWATLAHSRVYRAMSKDVSGYQIHPFGGDIFTNVELK